MKPLLLVGLGVIMNACYAEPMPTRTPQHSPQESSDKHDNALPDAEPTPQPSPGVKPTVSSVPTKIPESTIKTLGVPTAVERGSTVTFYATHYYAPVVNERSGDFPLLAMDGSELGAYLTRQEWCNAAMEGTVIVRKSDDTFVTYNYVGVGSTGQVDCSPYFNHTPSHRVRFQKVAAPFGMGIQNYQLVPYRTIATNAAHIQPGTVVYIEDARGVKVKLPTGEQWTHDGYFFAADAGGLIESGHIDVFLGTSSENPFQFISSKSTDKKRGVIINSKSVRDLMIRLHKGG